ncbi:MAG: xanthine dehydrogenase family protein subunit M [Betaproteobacteria bacterium]|nr:xanthine dehydrogenase family protein subunit M [Betaproteobacteria bacterium]
MSDLRYEAPKTLAAAITLLKSAKGLSKVLAESGRLEPALLVDVKGIAGMTDIVTEKSGFRIGAATPCMAVVEHKSFAKTWPGVTEAVALIGSIQVKGRASVGGNLCNGSPAADSVPALIAAGAVARIVGPKGKRDVPVEDIITGPGKTSLGKGEILASLFFAKRTARSGDAYLRFTPRTEMDIAVVGAGVNLTLNARGVCTAARVCLGAVAERAFLVPDAAAALIGSTIDDAALDKLAAAASAAARPIDDKRGTKEFRIKVSGVMARRAAVIARDRAQGKKS